MEYISASFLFMAVVTILQPLPARSTQSASSIHCDSGPCGSGYYFDNMKKDCELCPSGTYQSNVAHKCTTCTECSSPTELEEIVEDCNGNKDAVLTCIVGYFDAGNTGTRICQECKKCEDDEIIVRPCGNRRDTKCSRTTSPLNNADENSASDDHANEDPENGSESRIRNSNVWFVICSVTTSVFAFILRRTIFH